MPTWYPRQLRRWGRRRQVRVDFVLGPNRRLREGPEVEVALGELYVRLLQTVFVGCIAVPVSLLLLIHGPHLSQSTVNSWAVAGLPVAATVFAIVQLQELLQPYRTAQGSPRPAGTEDYAWPVVRALAWLLAGAGLLVPVLAGVLAMGPSYDADKVFWEGVVGHPLSGLAVVALVEWSLHRTR